MGSKCLTNHNKSEPIDALRQTAGYDTVIYQRAWLTQKEFLLEAEELALQRGLVGRSVQHIGRAGAHAFVCMHHDDRRGRPSLPHIADSLSYSLRAHLLIAPVIIRPVDARARSVADDYFRTNTGSSRGGAAANHGMGFNFAFGGSPLRPADGNAYSVATDPAAQRSANWRDERAVTTAVPEPSTYLLLLAGASAVVFMARRRRDQY